MGEHDEVVEHAYEWGRAWERDYHKAMNERDALAAENAALREALAKADFWLGAIPEPLDERVQMARLYLSAALASPDGTTEGE